MYSPTGYFAHYTATFRDIDGTTRSVCTDTFPVVGYTDVALILDRDGFVKTVGALLDELREGGGQPDPDDETRSVSLAVDAHPGE